MANFCFYQGNDLGLVQRIQRHAESLWGQTEQITAESFWLFIPTGDYSRTACESAEVMGAVNGYVRFDKISNTSNDAIGNNALHNLSLSSHVSNDCGWPLGAEWTGNFSAVAYSKSRRTVTIVNDAVGYLPLYYSAGSHGLIGATSLIILSRSMSCEVDAVGVLERITPPYCNYGRRTLIKQTSRLLPGERIKFSRHGKGAVSIFDNELCGEVIDTNINDLARRVWDCLQRETDLAIDPSENVCVALSGGWDSRLALATVASRAAALKTYTFGNGSLHEVRTARRCAMAVGAQHQFFPIENTYFPARSSLELLVEKTETANHLQWCTITDSLGNSDADEIILLGDLCESIGALNMKQFSTREARIRLFSRGLLGRTEEIPTASNENYSSWRHSMSRRIVDSALRNLNRLSPELLEDCRHAASEIETDLELCFSRVRDNNPKFAPMYDELFHWFHRARYLIAGQALFLSTSFRPLCPAVSLRFMRLISSVHPRCRIRRRLMNGMARLPEFDVLARIPSAQIPWLSARAPALLRELVWGTRSGLDQVLTRRALKKKNALMRQRVLPTLNYLKEYQRDNAIPNVRTWFSGKWLNSEKYIDLVKRRAEFDAWPLMNLDIAAPANVSITLDLCEDANSVARRASA